MGKIARVAAALLAVGFAVWCLYSVATKGRYQAVGSSPVKMVLGATLYVMNTQTGCLYRYQVGAGAVSFVGCPN